MLTKDRQFYKSFFSLFWVIVLQNVIVLSVNLADNIMIGGYSEVSLSGVAAVNQLQFIFQNIVMGLGEGVVILGSQYWGQKRTEPIADLGRVALLFAALFGVILFALTSLFPAQILSIFTDSAAIISEGVRYLSVIRFTYLIFALTNVLLAILRSVETVKIAFIVSVIALVTNCSINYALIGGNFGAPALGVIGAAIGTLVARCVEFVIVAVYVLFIDKKLSFRHKLTSKISSVLTKDYIKETTFIVIVGAMFGVSTSLQTVILGHMNDNAIAANSIATTLYQVLKVAAVGAASATSIIIGKTIGKGVTDKLKEYVNTLQVMFVVIGVLMSITLFSLRLPILSLYDLTPETKTLAEQFILILCVTCIGTSYEMPLITGVIRGGGDAMFVFYNDLISIWGIVLPLSFLAAFVFKWPPAAVVFCLNADQLFKCIPGAIKANRYKWIKKLTRESENENESSEDIRV